MDIHEIARKLEPLMPEQVERWLRILDVAQPEARELLERQIRNTAHASLGNFRDKILLSLPPQSTAKGTIHLGTILYEKEKWPAGISTAELTQNLAVFGHSGAGKTNVTFHILQQLVKRRIPFLFLDWKRTARHLIPKLGRKLRVYTPGRSISPFPFSPFIPPPGLETKAYINHVIDVMGDAYTLGDGAKSILQRALAACYHGNNPAPTVSDVLKALENIPTKERATGWKISATRALESLQFSDTAAGNKESQRSFAKSLLTQNTIVELDALSQSSKKFLVPLLCFWVYCVRLAATEREQLRYVVFLEEAHHVMYRQQQKTKESLMEMLLRQGRELGISFAVIDQNPHLMSSAAIGNCYTTICLNQKDPADINKAAALSLVGESDKRQFSMLPVGRGVVKLQDRWRKPFLVQFPLVATKKGSVTDAMLAEFARGKSSLSALRESGWPNSEGNGRSRGVGNALEEAAFGLLHDVVRNPNDGVDKRYKRLGISVDKGNRYKQQLVDHGFVMPEKIQVGRTHRVVLKVSDEARRMFRFDDSHTRHASFLHEYWKNYYGQRYKVDGYDVRLEAPRKHGRVDVLAQRASESVAIEVETGKSDAVWNVRQNLLEGFSRLVVVATDDDAFRKVERQLAKAGLLLPGRVDLVLADAANGG